MHDFLNNGTSHKLSKIQIDDLLKSIYGQDFSVGSEIFLGINLGWPKFNLPATYQRYFLSFHTEYMDIAWVMEQARRVYPAPILLVTDYDIEKNSVWPENITVIKYVTLHKQLDKATNDIGIATKIKPPCYKISSLSYRITQYKKFVTAYLLQHFNHSDMILTYHNNVGKLEDHHGYPDGYPYLDQLELESLTKTLINFEDDSESINISPVANASWQMAPYRDAWINLTNESWHYSRTILDGHDFYYPGPYLTEKTFKPLLAGRPFLAVGQYNTYKTLKELGLSVDFGFDTGYDRDTGDLTRIKGIFSAIDYIQNTNLDHLFQSAIDAVRHNLNYIRNNNLFVHCEDLNTESVKRIKDFI
jgi:hypothetical protein